MYCAQNAARSQRPILRKIFQLNSKGLFKMRNLILLCGLLAASALTSSPAVAQSANGFFPFGGAHSQNTVVSSGAGTSCGIFNTLDSDYGTSTFVFRGNGKTAGKFIIGISYYTTDSLGSVIEQVEYADPVIMTFASNTSNAGTLKWINNYFGETGLDTGNRQVVEGVAEGTFS
jgi:hypothetical protein